MPTRTINVGYLARVEGEAGLRVRIKDGRVEDVALNIFEAPRFFEALLRGRNFTEAPDITARICGICPVAYQMSSIQAMERICGIEVDAPLRDLRRLLYYGEWIESHFLHIHLLHAPDFLGYQDSIRLAAVYPEVVKRGLALKKLGNQVMTVVGGREIHPINVRVGGFYRVPTRAEMAALAVQLRWGLAEAVETVRWTASLPFPEVDLEYEFVSLRHPTEYPILGGRVISSRGIDIDAEKYEDVFAERHEARSNALHSDVVARGHYFVGPMAQFNLNRDRLSPLAAQAAADAGLPEIVRNPFQSIVVRAVEGLLAMEEALRIAEAYEPPHRPAVEVVPRAGRGFGVTEAPRGILYHRYDIDEDGTILSADIVPPTSQNLSTIEDDLTEVVTANITLPKAELTHLCEQAVRNYDPCISCATHFLNLDIEEM